MRIQDASENALLVELEPPALHALSDWLAREPLPGQIDLHPGYRSLLVRYDCLTTDPSQLRLELEQRHRHLSAWAAPAPRVHSLAVRFGGAAGADLEELAHARNLSPRAVIELFTSSTYTVAFLGFSPGFGYLSGLDPRLHTPRRASPRARVPEGSVAIGGAHAAVYPRSTPGGWNLIGTSDALLFDASRTPAATFRAGDRVRFFDRERA
jgi:KipI family sensor histidine kinase inhibitor